MRDTCSGPRRAEPKNALPSIRKALHHDPAGVSFDRGAVAYADSLRPAVAGDGWKSIGGRIGGSIG